MFKKISIAVLITILAALSGATLVSAEGQLGQKQSPDNLPNRRGLIGQVVQIGASSFEIESPNGETHQVEVITETIFRTRREGQEGEVNFSDLETGMWVAVFMQKIDPENLSARLVVLLPDDFDPSNLKIKRLMGKVDKINPGQETFEIITRIGDTITFQVDERTHFGGGIDSFDDLEKEMVVAVAAVQQEDQTLLAKIVAAKPEEKPRLQKTGGKISQLGESSLTILLRQGEELTFQVDGETRFVSRQGNIHGLDDLEIDMVVVVVHPAGNDQALAVLVADQALLRLKRTRGTVQSAGGSHLTISAGDEKINFTVDENTRFRGRGIEDLNDLKNGMKVLVLYRDKDESLLAKGILVFPSRGASTPKRFGWIYVRLLRR
ncbi:MAG: DUF5666 domain-containing protein [Anaerolineales bacterium]